MLVVLAGLGAGAFAVLRHQLDSDIDRSLEEALAEVRNIAPPATAVPPGGSEDHSAGGDEKDGHEDEEHHDDDDDGDPLPSAVTALPTDIFTVWLGRDGVVLANPRQIQLDVFPLVDLAGDANEGGLREISVHEDRYRLAVARGGPDSGAVAVFVGRSLDARDRQLEALAGVLFLGGVAGLALAAAGGYVIAGRTLAPIRAALETQRRFVSDASHELRTPVAVVRANAEVLLRHPGQDIDENIDQVAAIADEAEHMSRLVTDLLTLARADEQRLELVREAFELDELLASVVRDMAPVAEARGVELVSQLSPVTVDGDRQRIRQVVAILIDNAIKFTPAAGTVHVTCTREGNRGEFRVTDTGVGIEAAELRRIFERFYRADVARTGGGGTGLGLAIARSLVEAHGGQISVDSTPGRGTTFIVRLGSAHRA